VPLPVFWLAEDARRAEPQKNDWGRHIASIPNVILVRWMNEDGVNVLRERHTMLCGRPRNEACGQISRGSLSFTYPIHGVFAPSAGGA
jgi:hypothetical protein